MLGHQGIEARLKHLAAGDSLLLPAVAAERKTTADFVQSIFDKRLFAQVSKPQGNYRYPVLLLEKSTAPSREIHPPTGRGALLHMTVPNHLPILQWSFRYGRTAVGVTSACAWALAGPLLAFG